MEKSFAKQAAWVLAIPLFLAPLAGAAPSQISPTSDEAKAQWLEHLAAGYEADLVRDMAEVQRVRRHANDLRDLAKGEEKNAKDTSDPASKKYWLDIASDHKAQAYWVDYDADQFEKRAKEKADRAAEYRRQAAELRAKAPAPTPPLPPPQPPGPAGLGTDADLPEPPGTPLPFSSLPGDWKATGKGVTIADNITLAVAIREKFQLSLRGRHSDWVQEGPYNSEDGTVVFTRRPTAAQMGAKAPDWARQIVEKEGKLRWRLELKAVERCGQLVLEGKFYPGELKWTEKKNKDTNEVMSREATATGAEGEPLKVKYVGQPTGTNKKFHLTGAPGILIRSGSTPEVYYPIESVFKTEPFFVDVTLPREMAQRDTLDVNFRTTQTGKSTSFRLYAIRGWREGGTGPVTYSTGDSIFIADDGMVTPHTRLPFIGPINGGWRRVGLNGLANGENVVVSYGGASASFLIYDSTIQKGIARNENSFKYLEDSYRDLASDPRLSAAGQEKLRRKQVMIHHARQIIAHQPKPDENFTDYTRFEVGLAYLHLLGEDRGSGAHGGGSPDGFGVVYLDEDEREAVYIAVKLAEEQFQNMFTFVMQQLVLTEYQIVVTSSPFAGDFIAAFFQIDSMGEPVNTTGRILAGLNLVGGAVLLGAHSQLMADLSSSEPRIRRLGKVASEKESALLDRPVRNDPRFRSAGTAPTGATGANRPTIVPPPQPEEMDLNVVQAVYGPRARFAGTSVDEPIALQIDNSSCAVAVANQQARIAGHAAIPERLILAYARKMGFYEPGVGTTNVGYEDIIRTFGGRVGSAEASLSEVRDLLQDGYMIRATVRLGSGTDVSYHSVHVREVVSYGGENFFVVFDDPWVGKRVVLPTCDFEPLFQNNNIIHAVDFGQAHPRTP